MNREQASSEHYYESTRKSQEYLKEVGAFWSGPDIPLEKAEVIGSDETRQTNIVLSRDMLPPVSADRLTPALFNWLQLSVRSRLSQAGIEVSFSGDNISDDMAHQLAEGEEMIVPVFITNHSQRPVEVAGGVMRFFWADHDHRLTGDNLVREVDDHVAVQGKYGRDWSYVDDEGHGLWLEERQHGVALRFQLGNKRLYIPQSEEIVRINSMQDVEEALQEVPAGEDPAFHIRETAPVTFRQGVMGVINTGVHESGARHAQSPLIDPGYSKKIRAELVGRGHPSYIDTFLFKT